MTSDAAPAPARRRTGPIDLRLLRYASASRGYLVVTAGIVLAQTAVTAGFAWTLARALVGAIGGDPVASLVPWIAGGIGLALLRGALIAAGERTSAAGAARSSLQLRDRLLGALERLGPAWLSTRNSAALAVTAGHGLEALDAYFGRYLPQLVATAITMPLLVTVILVADPLSGLIVVLTLPLIPVFMVLIGLATQAVQRRQFEALHTLATRFSDTVAGLSTLKVFGRQHRAADTMERVTRDYKRETMAVLRVSFLSGFALEFLASISVAIVAVTIGFRLLDGEMTLLAGLFVLLLAPEAYLPLRQVGVQFHAAAEGVAATDEIFHTLDAAAALPASVPPVRLRETAGPGAPEVHDDGDEPVVRVHGLRIARGARTIGPVDLEVRAGEVVLIEGASGAGKSSVIAALLGFVDAEGDIAVAGEPAPDARRVLAWAGQRPGLMAGTLAENVVLGDARPDPGLAARCLSDALVDVPAGLELGALGAGVSGGQAQRIALARALYRLRRGHARVLALDEPSSALDSETEAGLWRMLRAEADAGAGVLLVSHRITARAIADRTVTLPLNLPSGSPS
ncbi:MAG: thiol reductant ABC exporter subunit CydD [Microbacterium sp.]